MGEDRSIKKVDKTTKFVDYLAGFTLFLGLLALSLGTKKYLDAEIFSDSAKMHGKLYDIAVARNLLDQTGTRLYPRDGFFEVREDNNIIKFTLERKLMGSMMDPCPGLGVEYFSDSSGFYFLDKCANGLSLGDEADSILVNQNGRKVIYLDNLLSGKNDSIYQEFKKIYDACIKKGLSKIDFAIDSLNTIKMNNK